MNLLTRENENEKSLLSATRPDSILQTDTEVRLQLQTKLRQKSIIKMYIKDNKYYVEHSAAYALGLINTRAIMLDSPKLIEISSDIHNKLKSNADMEIEYIKIEKKPLKVFADDTKFCITNSAAYALGLLTVEEFNNHSNDYYYISPTFLEALRKDYNVEIESLNIDNKNENKQL